jgi:hypothetical protein
VTKHIGGLIQKFRDWPPGARTSDGTALCHYVQLYSYFVSQSSEFCSHAPLCCVSTNNINVSVYFVVTQSVNFRIRPRIELVMLKQPEIPTFC